MININEEELQCKICYEFLSEAVICDKCSQAFCQECAINCKNKALKYGRVDKCPICGSLNFTFQRCEEIDRLIKKIKQKPLQCQHCKRIIFDKEKYEEHIKECKYQCKFCFMLFDKEDDLLRHIKKNTEELFKSLDLMNASRNKVKYNNEEKPKKKKIIKKKKKDIINNSNNNELKEENKIDNKKEDQNNKNLEKIDKLQFEGKKVEKQEDEKKMEKQVDEKKVEEKIEQKVDKIGNNSEFSKKVVKKKIIKKKIKIIKRKEGTKCNTINYFDKNKIEENLLENKMNKTNKDIEDKLITDINNLNIDTEKKTNNKKAKIKIKKVINKNFDTLKTEEKNNSNALKNLNNDKSNIKEISNDTNNNKPKEELEKKDDINSNESKEKKEEKILQIKNKNVEKEIIYPNPEKKNINNQIVEEEEKIGKYIDYLNNPKPESNKPATIPEDVKLNTEYDLYFCGKPNHIDCICCTDHKCKPGSCMCISCMKLNKKYHKLKSHYLINKSGRACKYSHGYFHCYCNYIHIVHDVGNNIFKPVYKCQGENVCKPCEEITLIMETYLPNTICQKLRDRETKQAQF